MRPREGSPPAPDAPVLPEAADVDVTGAGAAVGGADHGRLVSDAAIYLVAAVLGRLQFFVTLPIVSRQVTPGEYGVLTLANIVAVFVASTVQATVSGAVERFYADHDADERAECLGTIFGYMLALVAGAFVLVLLIGPTAKDALVEAESFPFWPYFLVPILTALIAVMNAFGTSLFRIEESPARVLLFSAVRFVVAVAAVYVAVAGLRGGLRGYLFALLATEAIVLVTALPLVLRRVALRFRGAYLRDVLAFTLPLAPYVLLALLRDTGDRWILQHFAGIEAIGIYGLGWGIAAGMNMVVSSLTVPYGAMMMKRFGGVVSAAKEEDNLRAFRGPATHVAVLTLVAYAMFLLIVQDAVRLLTPAPFHEAWKPAALLGGVFVLRGFYLMPHNVLQWVRRTGAIPVVTALGLMVGLPLILVLAPRLGTTAGPLGVGAAYAVAWLACWRFVPRPRWLFPWNPRPIALAALACALAAAAALNPAAEGAAWNMLRVVILVAGGAAVWAWVHHERRDSARGHPREASA